MSTTRTLIDIDDDVLARAAAKLGTTTTKDTVKRAVELIAADSDADIEESQRFQRFAQRSASRMAEINWDEAWR